MLLVAGRVKVLLVRHQARRRVLRRVLLVRGGLGSKAVGGLVLMVAR